MIGDVHPDLGLGHTLAEASFARRASRGGNDNCGPSVNSTNLSRKAAHQSRSLCFARRASEVIPSDNSCDQLSALLKKARFEPDRCTAVKQVSNDGAPVKPPNRLVPRAGSFRFGAKWPGIVSAPRPARAVMPLTFAK